MYNEINSEIENAIISEYDHAINAEIMGTEIENMTEAELIEAEIWREQV